MPHTELTNKSEYESAIATADKFVVIFAYEGEINPKAEEASERHAAKAVSYSVDVSKNTAAKEGLKITTVPTVIIYKGGKEVFRLDGVNPETAPKVHEFLESA